MKKINTDPCSVYFLDVGRINAEFRDALLSDFERVLASGRYVLGQEVESFESEFANYCGAKYCIGVGNGLDALDLLLRAAGISDGDEVIVPANTYIATWLAVSRVGATPVPVEPDEATFNLDATRIEAAITERTKAILAVHLYGRTAPMSELEIIAKRNGLWLFEDAAQSHGARSEGRRTGNLADGAGFSFYPGKNLGALGDAGGVTTDNPDLADRVRVLRNYGSRKKYENEIKGVNSRLDPLQAAMLRTKLQRLDVSNERRREIAECYARGLNGLPELVLPRPAGVEHVWHLYVVRHPRRDALANALAARGVQTLVHYPIPPHLSKAYNELGYREADFPLTERLAQQVLSLPMSPVMTQGEVDAVIDAVRDSCATIQ